MLQINPSEISRFMLRFMIRLCMPICYRKSFLSCYSFVRRRGPWGGACQSFRGMLWPMKYIRRYQKGRVLCSDFYNVKHKTYNGASMAQFATAHGLGNLNFILYCLTILGKPAMHGEPCAIQACLLSIASGLFIDIHIYIYILYIYIYIINIYQYYIYILYCTTVCLKFRGKERFF